MTTQERKAEYMERSLEQTALKLGRELTTSERNIFAIGFWNGVGCQLDQRIDEIAEAHKGH
jgi:hypothetical protein